MITGEGGMLTTGDTKLTDKIRMLREHGQRSKYWHEVLGYNYRMTDITAAIGLVQLGKLNEFNRRRRSNAEFYMRNMIARPYTAECCKHVFHQYTIRVNNRASFLKHLDLKGVGYGIHYPTPLHHHPMFKEYGNLQFPHSEEASEKVVSLPVHPWLTQEELKQVVEAVNSYEGW